MNSKKSALSAKFSAENYKELEELAALNYSIRQIAMYFNVNPAEMYREFDDPNSEIKYYYERGQLVAQANIDRANLKSAMTGNISAIERYDKKTRQIRYQQAKARILKGN